MSPAGRALARLICLDPTGAVLLQEGALPGAEVSPGESPHQTACRLALDVLGLTADDLGAPLANSCFAVRTERFTPVPTGAAPDDGFRWCDLAEHELGAELGEVVRRAHQHLASEPLRPTVRVLVVDAEDRALLFCSTDGSETFWFPPGGGIEVGETALQAARRELAEELGLAVPDDEALGPCVWLRRHVLPPGERTPHGLDLRERWYLLRVDDPALDHSGWTPLELQTIDAVRWWGIEQLRAETVDVVTPRALADLLPALLADHRAGRLPAQPVRVGV